MKSKIKSDALLDAISEIKNENKIDLKKDEYKIVDIITFCEDPKYLNLPEQNLNLWISQKIILKSFYMGTRGNKKIRLTKEEWKWLYANNENEERDGIVYEKNIDKVIEKLLKKEKGGFCFDELHLCMGRRASKTLLASIISAYEAYKLLLINNGDLYGYYGIPRGEEIHIINVALSLDSAGTLFSMIRQRIMAAPFFQGRVSKNITTTSIRMYTDYDLKMNKEKKDDGIEAKGSLVILCGHSNPDTLRGKSAAIILFDELAFYDETGKTPGSEFYNALEPSVKKFKKYGDGRLVEISSPNTMIGIFYDLFLQSQKTDHILSFQLPTWCVNEDISYESLSDERKRNLENFKKEYGAQWGKSGIYGNYFDAGLVDRCVRGDLSPHLKPHPKINYYMHVDPANGGDRYVAVLVAKERYTNYMGQKRTRAVLANVWIWEPVPGVGLLFNQIDKEVLDICKRYHVVAISYDQWNSIGSMQFLRSRGIKTIQTSFNRSFKAKIYQNLKDLMCCQPNPELLLYEEQQVILEMKSLKTRPTMRGQSILPDKRGEVKTDDLVDCLAGAVSMATDGVIAPLPQMVLAYTPGWR